MSTYNDHRKALDKINRRRYIDKKNKIKLLNNQLLLNKRLNEKIQMRKENDKRLKVINKIRLIDLQIKQLELTKNQLYDELK